MPPISSRSNLISNLFRPVGEEAVRNPQKISDKRLIIKIGSLVTFGYDFWKHDKNPKIIIIDNKPSNNKLSGINLNYLTYRDIVYLISLARGIGFSYRAISNSKTLKGSYRSYKKAGIRMMKILDPNSLIRVMAFVRNNDPAEKEVIRRNAQEQLRQVNPTTSQLIENPDNVSGIGG